MELEYIPFFLTAALVISSSLAVVALSNPIYSALSLVAALLSVAVVFAQLEAHFLAASQVIVYAGAIVVLVLFVLMLLNVKSETRTTREHTLVVAALGAGGALFLVVAPSLFALFSIFSGGDTARIGFRPEVSVGTVVRMGELLFSKYVITFEAASVLIMVAIVGAVLLARRVNSERASEQTAGLKPR